MLAGDCYSDKSGDGVGSVTLRSIRVVPKPGAVGLGIGAAQGAMQRRQAGERRGRPVGIVRGRQAVPVLGAARLAAGRAHFTV